MQKHISVTEAICGFSFVHTHLDDRKILVKSEPGRVYNHGDLMCIEGEGMPLEGDHYNNGRLFILFKIDMPAADEITEEQKTALLAILPPPAGSFVEEDGDMEVVELTPVDDATFGQAVGGGST